MTSADADTEPVALMALLREQPSTTGIDVEAVSREATRADLGLTSLDVILLVVHHIERAGGDVDLRPEWVGLLDDVEGILSVMRQIDEMCGAGASS